MREQRNVEDALASLIDPPGRWPTRVSGVKAFAAVTLVVLTAVLAVVALPRLVPATAGHGSFDSTTVRLPAEIEGLPRVAEDRVTAQDTRSAPRLLAASRFPLDTMVGVYGRPTGVRITVAAGRPAEPIPEADIASIRDGFASGMAAAGGQLHEIDPGRFGGWFGCARLEHGQTLCLALDSAAMVSISVTGADPSAIPLAEAARNAVEHRA